MARLLIHTRAAASSHICGGDAGVPRLQHTSLTCDEAEQAVPLRTRNPSPSVRRRCHPSQCRTGCSALSTTSSLALALQPLHRRPSRMRWRHAYVALRRQNARIHFFTALRERASVSVGPAEQRQCARRSCESIIARLSAQSQRPLREPRRRAALPGATSAVRWFPPGESMQTCATAAGRLGLGSPTRACDHNHTRPP